jgi:hypothetical protein
MTGNLIFRWIITTGGSNREPDFSAGEGYLVEHIWTVVGVASTGETLEELRYKMEQLYGNKPGFQYQLKLVENKTQA